MTLPNLYLLSPPRSGTTQLAAWLNSHTDITASAIKEPNFFSHDEMINDAKWLNDIDPRSAKGAAPLRYQVAVTTDMGTYQSLYADRPERFKLDASTSYFTHPTAAQDILNLTPSARAIVVLRDPFDRALSHYKLALRTGRTLSSLGDVVTRELAHHAALSDQFIIRPSLYRAHLDRLKTVWPKDQILYFHFRDLCLRPAWVLKNCADFLDIPNSFDPNIEKRNTAYRTRMPWVQAMIWHLGLNNRLRRILTPEHKNFLRPLWFSQTKPIEIPAEDRLFLRHALAYHQDYCPAP